MAPFNRNLTETTAAIIAKAVADKDVATLEAHGFVLAATTDDQHVLVEQNRGLAGRLTTQGRPYHEWDALFTARDILLDGSASSEDKATAAEVLADHRVFLDAEGGIREGVLPRGEVTDQVDDVDVQVEQARQRAHATGQKVRGLFSKAAAAFRPQ